MNCCGHNHNNGKQSKKHGTMSHVWMMALCCGAPLLILLAVSALGANFPAVRTFLISILPFACPVLMVLMVPMMFVHGRRKDCGQVPAEAEQEDELSDGRRK